jgi:hypothetical protein
LAQTTPFKDLFSVSRAYHITYGSGIKNIDLPFPNSLNSFPTDKFVLIPRKAKRVFWQGVFDRNLTTFERKILSNEINPSIISLAYAFCRYSLPF